MQKTIVQVRRRMRKEIIYVLVIICIAAVTVAYSAPVSPSSPASTSVKDTCLGCHGPFDKLTAAPKTFTTESRQKINLHVYVPHDRKDAQSIPECVNCHQVHPVPLKSKEGLQKANVDWCFSCHHTQDFNACKTCH